MAEFIRSLDLRVAYITGFAVASVLLLLWNTAAYAQSREDQYGSPADPVDSADRVSGTLSVLPDTGGPLLLIVGVALVVVGTGVTLVRRIGRG